MLFRKSDDLTSLAGITIILLDGFVKRAKLDSDCRHTPLFFGKGECLVSRKSQAGSRREENPAVLPRQHAFSRERPAVFYL